MSLRNRLPFSASCLALLALAVGCGDDGGLYEGESATAGDSAASVSGDGGEGGDGGSGGEDPSGGEGDSAPGDEGADSGAAEGGEAGEGGEGGEVPQPGQLTAGEWRDLDHWQFWLDLLQQEAWSGMAARWDFATQSRYSVVVESEVGKVVDASVTLLAGETVVWSARTDVHGEAELFAGLFAGSEGPYSLKVTSAGSSEVVEAVEPSWEAPIVVDVQSAEAPSPVLDLMFVIDTTGSMGDELSYLQAELADVLDRVRAKVGADVKLRVSVNFYRDDGDEYVVRPFEFTEDVDQAIDDLNAQSADGGGDWPEAIDAAMVDAIDNHAWSESAIARLCFVVLDAPPHEGQEPLARVQESVRKAATKGVRVIPLAASGVDKDLEFLLRFQAIATGGTYTFLTNDSGIGGEHIEPTIGDYQVEILNDLLVRVISGALVD